MMKPAPIHQVHCAWCYDWLLPDLKLGKLDKHLFFLESTTARHREARPNFAFHLKVFYCFRCRYHSYANLSHFINRFIDVSSQYVAAAVTTPLRERKKESKTTKATTAKVFSPFFLLASLFSLSLASKSQWFSPTFLLKIDRVRL